MGSFECKFNGDEMRFIEENDRVKRQRIYVDPKSGKRSWITEYLIDGRDVPGICALLAERARRAECWRELMEVAKASIKCLGDEECMCEQHERVRALQAKWDEGARA